MQRILCGAALAAALVLLTGCGDSGPKIAPASGVVLIDGHPLTYGYVQVLPAGFRPATGQIGPDGRFTLTTTAQGDGCAVGTHPVVILSSESISADTMKWHAPQKYADVKTADLKVTITEGTNDLKIELKGDGSKPAPRVNAEGGTEFQGLK